MLINQWKNMRENKLLLITSIKIMDEYFETKKTVDVNKKEIENITEKFKELKNISTFTNNENKQLFHAGTLKKKDGKIYSAGGRVINSTVISNSLKQARNQALETLDNLVPIKSSTA